MIKMMVGVVVVVVVDYKSTQDKRYRTEHNREP